MKPFLFFCFFSFVCFLGLHLQYMEVSRLGVSELCHWPTLQRQQCQILHPPSEAGNQTCVFTDTSQVCYHRATTGTPEMKPFLMVH